MDVVVTVPKAKWAEWLAEGDRAGEPWSGALSYFRVPTPTPRIEPGERVYIVAHWRLRGYAPLIRVAAEVYIGWDGKLHETDVLHWPREGYRSFFGAALVRGGGAVAVTIESPIRGFRGIRYRWWPREAEEPFQDWRTP